MTHPIVFDLLILLVVVLIILIWWRDITMGEKKWKEIWNSVPLLKAHVYGMIPRTIATLLLLGRVVYVAIIGYNAYWWGH